MVTFKFVLRLSSKAGRYPGSLSLRVIHNRKPKTISICCRLYPEEWDEVSQAINYSTADPKRVEYLRDVEKQIESCVDTLNEIVKRLEEQGNYTVADVIKHYHNTSNESKLTGYAAYLSAGLIESEQHRTAKAYGTACRGLVAYNNGVDIPLEQINATLIRGFETYLKENSKRPNTISYYMRNLRAIYNKAVSAGRIAKDEKPFAGVFTGVEETKKRALNASEVNKINAIDFDKLLQQLDSDTAQARHIQNLEFARRLFLFCLYAHGMCFVDLCHLKKTQLKNGVLRYYRKKTGKQIEVPVNEGMLKIIESFEPMVKDSDYLFPLLTGSKNLRLQYETALRTQNRRLKKLALLAGLEKDIATHVARHSWASILKNAMQPLSVISEGLGHSSEKMTRKYLASFDHSILKNAGRLVLNAVLPVPDSPAALP